jgi:hypothetical protein
LSDFKQSTLTIDKITSDVLDVRVFKSDDGNELELTWVPLSLSPSSIEINIDFAEPLEVSTGMAESGRRDTMIVTVIDTSLFKAQTDSG